MARNFCHERPFSDHDLFSQSRENKYYIKSSVDGWCFILNWWYLYCFSRTVGVQLLFFAQAPFDFGNFGDCKCSFRRSNADFYGQNFGSNYSHFGIIYCCTDIWRVRYFWKFTVSFTYSIHSTFQSSSSSYLQPSRFESWILSFVVKTVNVSLL